MSETILKTEFIDHKIQQVEISDEGTVISSDDAIFALKNGNPISDLHPFFEGIQQILPTITHHITFPCVNVEIGKESKIIDIEMIRRKSKLFMLLFDFTPHYEASHPIVQEKNEVSIAKSKLDFEKRLLQAKEEFKNNFLSNINHEIRNPLNNMLGFIDLLAETKLNYDQNETVKVIRRTGKHIKMLMDDMLDISKIERGVITIKHVNFYLSSIIASLQNHFSLKYNSEKVRLEVQMEEHMAKTFIGDPIRLNQILFNLLENAFRHTHEGLVQLKVYSEDIDKKMARVHFKVSDTGVGIPAEELKKVFDSYYQLKLDKEKPIGEGLGLKIVKDLVELLEGDIQVSSSNGQGSIFHCSIPFEKRVPKREKKTVSKGSGIMRSKRILIVEDESTNQILFMKTFLNNDKGYVIELANDASQALTLLEKRKYDLVIVKRNYPDMEGTELIEKIVNHAEGNISQVPVLMASGSTLIHEQQEFLDAGASLFLPKPYSKKELFNQIEKLIR
ncbi:MAG: response regulator [Flavobacteriaceae bacterium]|nr:response regulator [Flavobacteriaceae bacterium]